MKWVAKNSSHFCLYYLKSRKFPFRIQQGKRWLFMNRFQTVLLIRCTIGNPDIVPPPFSKQSCISVNTHKAMMKSRKTPKDLRYLILRKCISIIDKKSKKVKQFVYLIVSHLYRDEGESTASVHFYSCNRDALLLFLWKKNLYIKNLSQGLDIISRKTRFISFG